MIQRVSEWWVMGLGLTRSGWRDWCLVRGEASVSGSVRITEWFGSEGAFKGHLVQSPCLKDIFH